MDSMEQVRDEESVRLYSGVDSHPVVSAAAGGGWRSDGE